MFGFTRLLAAVHNIFDLLGFFCDYSQDESYGSISLRSEYLFLIWAEMLFCWLDSGEIKQFHETHSFLHRLCLKMTGPTTSDNALELADMVCTVPYLEFKMGKQSPVKQWHSRLSKDSFAVVSINGNKTLLSLSLSSEVFKEQTLHNSSQVKSTQSYTFHLNHWY